MDWSFALINPSALHDLVGGNNNENCARDVGSDGEG